MNQPAGPDRPSVVMFVRNACTNDARVLREAATLHEAGWTTTIMALQPRGPNAPPDREERGGVQIIRVAAPSDWRARWREMRYYPWRALRGLPREVVRQLRAGPSGIGPAATAIAVAIVTMPYTLLQAARYVLSRRARPRPHDEDDGLDHLAWWRLSLLGWAARAAAAAPIADVYHGHDLTGLPAAIRASARGADRPAVVYDSHEIFIDSATTAERPRWVRAILAWLERRWAGRTDALVTVNPAYAQVIARRIRPRQTVVVHNCPPRWTPTGDERAHLEAAAGVPAGAPIVLYHGAFSRHRGLEQLAEAALEPGLESAHVVFLGYGSQRPMLDALVAEPRFGGRLHVLDAVPPDELPAMVAGADVDAIPLQHSTLNHWLCTPNKLFESISAGVPVVVSDFPVMRGIVLDDPDGPLGAVCDPASPPAIARAIRSILDRSPSDRQALRARCLAAAHQRWNWEQESTQLLELYGQLAPGAREYARAAPPGVTA